jgi:hypothetical protein
MFLNEEKILSELEPIVLMKHVSRNLEDRVYLSKPVAWKRDLCDKYDVFKGIL